VHSVEGFNEQNATSWVSAMGMRCALPTKGCGTENVNSMKSHFKRAENIIVQQIGSQRGTLELLLKLHDIASLGLACALWSKNRSSGRF
jgi:hypothetical protein